LNVFKKLLNWW